MASLAVLPTLASAADPTDAVALLRDAAQAVANAPSASVDFTASSTFVRDGESESSSVSHRFRRASEGRYEFVATAADGGEATEGYHVVGDDQVMVTHVLGRGRHMLEAPVEGFAAFVRTPVAARLGGGLGGVALATLSPAVTQEVIDSLTESEVIGREELDGQPAIRARYHVGDEVVWDTWYAAEGEPVVLRIQPDVSRSPNVQRMASRYAEFEYELRFDFTDWNLDAGIQPDEIVVAERPGSVLQVSLYRRPPRPPHALLGQPAPEFELETPAGEPVSLAAHRDQDVVLLEFWSTGCHFCLQAMPELEAIEEKYADRGLAYYAVNIGEDPAMVASFLKERGLDSTAVIDTSGEVSDAYAVGPIPLILLVGRDGKVQSAREGFAPTTPAQLETEIDALLEDQDLAAQRIAAMQAQQQAEAAERDRLRSLLDG